MQSTNNLDETKNFDSIKNSIPISQKPITNTFESEEESEEIVEAPKESFKSISHLPLFEQMKRIKEDEWKNIPKVVKQTFRLLINFSLQEKENADAYSKKTTTVIER